MDQRMLIPSETFIDDRVDLTTDDVVRLAPGGESFQVEGPGMIDTVLVRADTDTYQVEIGTDEATIVSDDWSTLNTLSDDLAHVSAYEDNGTFVVVVQDYPYQGFSTVTIDPNGSVTFERLRAEWIRGIPVSY